MCCELFYQKIIKEKKTYSRILINNIVLFSKIYYDADY